MKLRVLLLLCALAAGAVTAQPAGSASPFDEAAAALRSGRLDEAERLLRAVVRQQPGDVRALGLLGVVLDELKRYAEAEPYLQRAAELAPQSASVWNNLGNHLVATGRPERARTAFLKAVAIQPRHPNANLQLAQIAAAAKQGAETLRFLDRLDAAAAASAEIQVLRARALNWTGRTDAAAELLARLEEPAAGNPRLATAVGMAYADGKRYAEAERVFGRVLETEPGNFDVLYNLALAALRAGRLDRARSVFAIALEQRPGDVDALFGFAQASAQSKQEETAAVALVRAMKLAPQRADVLLLLAQCFNTLGYWGDAVDTYDKYLKLQPGDDLARRERAFIRTFSGADDASLVDLESYVRKHPNEPMGLLELALAERRKNPDQALRRLNRVLELDPGFVDAYYARGAFYYERGDPANAVKDLEFVVARQPDKVRALHRLGQAYLRLEKVELAAKALQRASELAPKDPRVLIHYSQALRLLGREEELRSVIARFRQLGDEVKNPPISGLLDFLTLTPAEQQTRYAAQLKKLMEASPDDPKLRVRWMKLLLAQGKTGEAISALQEIRRLTNATLVLEDLGRTLLRYEQYAPARDLFQAVLDADPKSKVRLDLVIALFHSSNAAAALPELDKIPEEQRLGDYYLLRAQILDSMGKFEEAVASLNRGFRAEPTRADLYLEASSFLLKHKRYEEALQLLEAAARTVPESPEILLTQALALEMLQKTDDTLNLLKQIEIRWPEWRRPYLVHGIILEVHNQPSEARQMVEAAIALGEQSAEAYFYQALTITRSEPENIEAARKAVTQALEINPDEPYARALAGKLALAAGDAQAAVEHLRVATRLFPNMVQAHYTLANAYRTLGREEEALAAMKEVRRIREENPHPEMETPPVGDVLFTVRPLGGNR